MHVWGDDWFEANGKDLYAAIEFIETYLRKHHIGIFGKEKYGTYRDEYLRFWEGGLYQILFGNRLYIGTFHTYRLKESPDDIIGHVETSPRDDFPIYNENAWRQKFNNKIAPKLVDIANKFHRFIAYRIDEKLKTINWKIGLTQFVQKIQAMYYNYAFQLACKKWPHVQDELISDIDGYKMIKPCKYGNIDGEKIHNKYWKEYV